MRHFIQTPEGTCPIQISTPACIVPETERTPGQPEKLYVIATINNYAEYHSRYKLFHMFQERMLKEPLVEFYVVEVALGQRQFMVTQPNNPKHLQLRTDDELWHKENSINLMVQRLPPSWKYLATIDADITFLNPGWVEDTINALQHFEVVQMFQTAVHKGPEGEVVNTVKSFMWQWHLSGSVYPASKKEELKNIPQKRKKNGLHRDCGYGYAYGDKNFYTPGGSGELWHPGFAWAYTRRAFNVMGGLIDFSILGSGDYQMAMCFIGEGLRTLPKGVHKNYVKMIKSFQKRVLEHIRMDVGYVVGTIAHDWHGSIKSRRYNSRWDILKEGNYDPAIDIKRDWQGLLVLNADHKPAFRDGLRRYFQSRNEDSIDRE